MTIIVISIVGTVIVVFVIWAIIARKSSKSSSSMRCQLCTARLPVKESKWGVPSIYGGEPMLMQDVTCTRCKNKFVIKRPMEMLEYFVYWPNNICEWVLDYTEKALRRNPKDGGLWLLRGRAYQWCGRRDYLAKKLLGTSSPSGSPAYKRYNECFEKVVNLRRKDGSVPCDFYDVLIVPNSPSALQQDCVKESDVMLAVLYTKVVGRVELNEAFVANLTDTVKSLVFKRLW